MFDSPTGTDLPVAGRFWKWPLFIVIGVLVLVLGAIAVWLFLDSEPTRYSSAREVAERLNCESRFVEDDDPEWFVDDAGACRIFGIVVQIKTFESEKTLNNWWSLMEEYGTSNYRKSGLVVLGVSSSSSRATLDRVVDRLG